MVRVGSGFPFFIGRDNIGWQIAADEPETKRLEGPTSAAYHGF